MKKLIVLVPVVLALAACGGKEAAPPPPPPPPANDLRPDPAIQKWVDGMRPWYGKMATATKTVLLETGGEADLYAALFLALGPNSKARKAIKPALAALANCTNSLYKVPMKHQRNPKAYRRMLDINTQFFLFCDSVEGSVRAYRLGIKRHSATYIKIGYIGVRDEDIKSLIKGGRMLIAFQDK